jgi:hypothetical protein
MFERLKKNLGKMKSGSFWKDLALNQGKQLLGIFIRGKIEDLITEFLIRRPMLAAERLRKKNGYGPANYSLLNKISNTILSW